MLAKQQQSEATRKKILIAAAEEMYRVGYQSTSLADIINKLNVSKGAIYHHFPNKKALGYAVIEEVFTPEFSQAIEPLLESDNPLLSLIQALEDPVFINDKILSFGCPINNIAQEMSALDEEFRLLIEHTYNQWQQKLVKAFERTQQQQRMKTNCDLQSLSWMVVAIYQGCMGLCKTTHDGTIPIAIAQGVAEYMKTLQL